MQPGAFSNQQVSQLHVPHGTSSREISAGGNGDDDGSDSHKKTAPKNERDDAAANAPPTDEEDGDEDKAPRVSPHPAVIGLAARDDARPSKQQRCNDGRAQHRSAGIHGSRESLAVATLSPAELCQLLEIIRVMPDNYFPPGRAAAHKQSLVTLASDSRAGKKRSAGRADVLCVALRSFNDNHDLQHLHTVLCALISSK